MDESPRVLGVDACPAGWVGVVLGGGEPRALVAAEIGALVERAAGAGPLAAVGIDIPIGLPDRGRRRADELARRVIGRLGSSVFMTAVRPALEAPDHASAVVLNRRLAGEGVSRQAYGLRAKLFQVDAWVRSARQPVIEVHPEVSFAQMNGGPLTARKSTWAGAAIRSELLAAHGIALRGTLGLDGLAVGVDDVLDAGAAAWSARRYAEGRAVPRPDPPEVFDDGWPAAIWA